MKNNFMIGMHGKYDEVKYSRDFRKGFYGIQACLFEDVNDTEKLFYEAKDKGFNIGIHFPLRADSSKLRDPQFLSLNEDIRIDAYKQVEEELNYIRDKQFNPDYILFHYPKPVILKKDFDLCNWRFANKSEYTYEANYPNDKFRKHSEILFKWLSEKGLEYNFTPVLEFDGLNKYICQDNFVETLLEKYKTVKICLDTGRLHLQSKIDSDFSDIEIIKRFAKYTDVIHLWNAKILGNLENNHFPALPNLKVEDGWAPIENYLKIIKKENKNIKIMFEHRSDLISNKELDNCYSWISSILE